MFLQVDKMHLSRGEALKREQHPRRNAEEKFQAKERRIVPPAGFEPATPTLGKWCSIQLSYEGNALGFLSQATKRFKPQEIITLVIACD